jgi:hypothetical protein
MIRVYPCPICGKFPKIKVNASGKAVMRCRAMFPHIKIPIDSVDSLKISIDSIGSYDPTPYINWNCATFEALRNMTERMLINGRH